MKVQILGAGAVGAYFGGQLARTGHEVTCYARGANLAAIQERGLEIRTPEDTFHVQVGTADRPEALPPADFAILAVKSYSLTEIAPAVRRCGEQGTAVGVAPEWSGDGRMAPGGRRAGGGDHRRHRQGERRPRRCRPGGGRAAQRIPQCRRGRARRPDQRTGRAHHRGVPRRGRGARSSNRIEVELWEKFIFISTLAAACGLARSPVGPLRAEPLGRRLLRRALEENVAVARARGVPLPEDADARAQKAIDGLAPGIKPSFLVDLESGGPTELDILSGAVSRLAESLGVAAPIHDTATVALARRP